MKRALVLDRSALVAALVLTACSSGGSSSTDGSGGADSSSDGTQSTGSQSTSSQSGTQAGGGGSDDPYAGAREACIATINELRATRSLAPYGRWVDAETCVDEQATADETSGTAHGAWSSGTYSCNGSAQNECLGSGPSGIVGCLQSMWAERDQAGCQGCDACAGAYDPDCPNCDFFGDETGDVCGHYVNMSAQYLTEAACGFSALGGWAAINFR
jgi:hypothetical protein